MRRPLMIAAEASRDRRPRYPGRSIPLALPTLSVPLARPIVSLLLAGLASCADTQTPPTLGDWPPPAIVLTFDDGPLPADLHPPIAGNTTEQLLEPLRAILLTLAQNGAPAVFFIEGPGQEALDSETHAAFALALGEIHAGGHTIGYHAYDQDPAIWIRPALCPVLAAMPMAADLDRLTRFLDEVAPEAGLQPDQLFEPVFRQPFGGLGISRTPAMLAAAARGWTYHGFRIDSADWMVNADTPRFLAEPFEEMDESQRVELVVRRLRQGVRRNAGQAAVVDVLFHVNRFTGRHLQTWLDALEDETAAVYGLPAGFSVPQTYIRESDPVVDFSVLEELLPPSR
jgi:peptidoglycan/xylan/chitin deacetylase (PgdA/CDA1 family)